MKEKLSICGNGVVKDPANGRPMLTTVFELKGWGRIGEWLDYSGNQEHYTSLFANSPEVLEALESLADKVQGANDLQHSRKSHTIPPSLWAELYSLVTEARVVIAKAKGF